jgi:hypothetical protein
MPLHHRVLSDQALVLVEASGQARRAFVVTSEVAFGLARMFDILTEDRGHELQVFTTMPEAREWLGMP